MKLRCIYYYIIFYKVFQIPSCSQRNMHRLLPYYLI